MRGGALVEHVGGRTCCRNCFHYSTTGKSPQILLSAIVVGGLPVNNPSSLPSNVSKLPLFLRHSHDSNIADTRFDTRLQRVLRNSPCSITHGGNSEITQALC